MSPLLPHQDRAFVCEPPADIWRSRCLLAQAILNQRATVDGLNAADVEDMRGALSGTWDAP